MGRLLQSSLQRIGCVEIRAAGGRNSDVVLETGMNCREAVGETDGDRNRSSTGCPSLVSTLGILMLKSSSMINAHANCFFDDSSSIQSIVCVH